MLPMVGCNPHFGSRCSSSNLCLPGTSLVACLRFCLQYEDKIHLWNMAGIRLPNTMCVKCFMHFRVYEHVAVNWMISLLRWSLVTLFVVQWESPGRRSWAPPGKVLQERLCTTWGCTYPFVSTPGLMISSPAENCHLLEDPVPGMQLFLPAPELQVSVCCIFSLAELHLAGFHIPSLRAKLHVPLNLLDILDQ